MITNETKDTMIQMKPVSELSDDIELKLDEADKVADYGSQARLSRLKTEEYENQ